MATNYLRSLMDNPGSFQGSPGYQFGLEQGQQAIRRRNPAMRGSGNVLAALTQHAVGSAQQDYGNEFNRRLQADALSQEGDQFSQRLALDDKLGTGALGVSQGRLAMDDRLGTGRLGLERDDLGLRRTNSDRDFGLRTTAQANDFELGSRGADLAETDSWRRHSLGGRRLALDESTAANDYSLRRDAGARGWYDSQTQRGSARSQDWGRRQVYRQRDPWGR
jgi:hypothetical protein